MLIWGDGGLLFHFILSKIVDLGPVVRRPFSTNPRLNVDTGFFFFCSKAFSGKIFSITINELLYAKRIKLIYLNSNFALTLGYLNPALNNPALLVGSDRKYENRSKYKNKTQTAVTNIVSYHRCLCYIFDPTAWSNFSHPPLPCLWTYGRRWPRFRATSGYGVRIPLMYPVGIRCLRVFQILETEDIREATRN